MASLVPWRVGWTWCVSHRGVPAAVATVVVASVFWLVGSLRIEVFDPGHTLPAWALLPGSLALIAASTISDRLAAYTLASPRSQWLARTIWMASVAGTMALTSQVVGATIGIDGLWVVATVFVLAAFALSAVWIGLAWIFVVGVEVWALVFSRSIASVQTGNDLLSTLGGSATRPMVGFIAAACLAYPILGAQLHLRRMVGAR